MSKIKDLGLLILAICIALGLVIAGYFVFKGLKSFSDKDRIVTVKGLAEKEIKSTQAFIKINISFSGDIPKALISKTDNQVKDIQGYLKEKGYIDGDIKVSQTSFYDGKEYYRYDYELKQKIKIDRYRSSRTIIISTKNVEKASEMSNNIDLDLINRNLSSSISCEFVFPELNSIKPALIAESTKNARLAGEQFANDSQSKLGKIKTASQGQISIVGSYYNDEEVASSAPKEAYLQKARVVSTIVFFLED